MRKALLLLVVLAGFVAGCENKYKDPDPQAMGYDYYPLEVGDYRIYNVTDTKYSSNKGETTRFQLRERVDTSFYDQTNQLVYKIIRSIRLNENSNWLDDSVMVVSKTERMVLLTKDNTKYVKLVFPVKESKEWVGDAYNSKVLTDGSDFNIRDGKEVYTYADVSASYQLEGQTYPKTVTVIQGTPYNNVKLNDRKEVYAEGVGLIYRLFNRVVYCEGSEVNTDCTMGVKFKQSGHERHEVLVSHGKM